LTVGPEVKIVYLQGSPELIAQRLSQRHGHYMDPALLESQFSTLEEPSDAVVVDVDAPVPDIVADVRRALVV
jgi:gluconokinase